MIFTNRVKSYKVLLNSVMFFVKWGKAFGKMNNPKPEFWLISLDNERIMRIIGGVKLYGKKRQQPRKAARYIKQNRESTQPIGAENYSNK